MSYKFVILKKGRQAAASGPNMALKVKIFGQQASFQSKIHILKTIKIKNCIKKNL